MQQQNNTTNWGAGEGGRVEEEKGLGKEAIWEGGVWWVSRKVVPLATQPALHLPMPPVRLLLNCLLFGVGKGGGEGGDVERWGCRVSLVPLAPRPTTPHPPISPVRLLTVEVPVV